MIARAARSFRISGSSRLRYRSDQSVRSLLERVRSGGLATEALPSVRAEVLIQHGLHAGLTYVHSGFRCSAVGCQIASLRTCLNAEREPPRLLSRRLGYLLGRRLGVRLGDRLNGSVVLFIGI